MHRANIVPLAVAIWGAEPVTFRALRRLDDGSLRSAPVELGHGWTISEALRTAAIQQVAILFDRLRLGDVELTANGFFVAPAGAVLPSMTALEP